jgi:glutamate 5-kinase
VEQNGSAATRRFSEVRRLVVKVGSSSLVDASGTVVRARMGKIVRDVTAAVQGGRACVLVSSGAIASGLEPLGLARRPKDLASLQAAAAVGQGRLMAGYASLFARHRLLTAQVLLTQDDFEARRRFVNAQRTFERLLVSGAVPVVNENDTVATEEITFGDNDRLAALVAIMVRADLLVLLSDVDGIFTKDPSRPGARLIAEFRDPLSVEPGPASAMGSGGMASKVQAATLASAAGIPTVVANAARRDVLAQILSGEAVGTLVPARAGRKRGRKAWMAFASAPRGRILVDAGAERAVREDGRSLLAAGVVAVEGGFAAGDAVEIAGPGGLFARGITSYSAADIAKMAGPSRVPTSWRTTRPLPVRKGPSPANGDEVIHRDVLVVTKQEDRWTS